MKRKTAKYSKNNTRPEVWIVMRSTYLKIRILIPYEDPTYSVYNFSGGNEKDPADFYDCCWGWNKKKSSMKTQRQWMRDYDSGMVSPSRAEFAGFL